MKGTNVSVYVLQVASECLKMPTANTLLFYVTLVWPKSVVWKLPAPRF